MQSNRISASRTRGEQEFGQGAHVAEAGDLQRRIAGKGVD
jgi:hypothetical protein